MLKRYEITRKSKWLAILNFLLASFIVYSLNSVIVYYFADELEHEQVVPYVVRVVANSNLPHDQAEKELLAKEVEQQMQQLSVKPAKEAAQMLYTQLQQRYPQKDVQVFVGPQLIPPKIVDNRLYPQGKTEAIVVKIGQARGDNWFCAVYPDSCEPEFPEQEEEKPVRKSLFKRLWKHIVNAR